MDEAVHSDVVDVAFSLRGEAVDPDYAYALLQAVSRALPWIGHEPRAGIHPLKGATASGERLVLARRAQLWLRLPQGRASDAAALGGKRFDLGGEIEVGEGVVRRLVPYPVLYSHFVSVGIDAEEDFVLEATRLVTAARIECKLIVGKRRQARSGGGRVSGYSLMLHGLSAAHSLQAQGAGLGGNRMLGCGIFVPHKSIAPVGT